MAITHEDIRRFVGWGKFWELLARHRAGESVSVPYNLLKIDPTVAWDDLYENFASTAYLIWLCEDMWKRSKK